MTLSVQGSNLSGSTGLPSSQNGGPSSSTRGRLILETVDLTKSFGGLLTVNGVNLRMNSGELRVIIGPNGAGKTTLFNLITGYLKPTKGKVLLNGEDITRLQTHERCKKGISRSFQVTSIFPELTVRENVWLGINASACVPWHPFQTVEDLAHASRKVEEICESVQLGDKLDAMAASLSHGDQRLLEIAIALSSSPSVLLLDEPTQGVGPKEVENFNQVIKKISQETTTLVIEHNMATVLAIADVVTVMHEGQTLAEGSPSVIVANKVVQEVYLGLENPV